MSFIPIFAHREKINKMTPSDFVNYAVSKRCYLEMKGSENLFWLKSSKGGECYISTRYKKIFYENAVRNCIALKIDIISEREYDAYE
jgi:hypothetical protein